MGEKRRNTCLTVTEAAPGPKLNLGGFTCMKGKEASGTEEQGGICIEVEGQGQTPLVHRKGNLV